MILQCPSCDARFKVGVGAIPAAGRKVRCARCMHEWQALPGDLLKPEAAPRKPTPAPQPARAPEAPRAAAASPASRPEDEAAAAMEAVSKVNIEEEGDYTDAEVVAGFDLPPPGAAVKASDKPLFSADAFAAAMKTAGADIEDRPPLSASGFSARRDMPEVRDEYVESDDDEDDFLARRRAEQRRQSEIDRTGRRRRFILILWILLILFWGAIAGAIFGMRDTVTALWPKSAAIYSWIDGQNDAEALKEKLAEEGKPLSKPITEAATVLAAFLESSSVEERDGEQVLVVKGYVENQGTRAATVPQVEIRINDAAGNTVDSWVVNPPGQIIARGGKVAFSAPRSPIPAGAASAEVRILEGTKSEEAADTSNLYERGH